MTDKLKKTVNISAEEGTDLYNVLSYLQARYGAAKPKVIEAILDRYLPLVLEASDPRLEFEGIERANNLEAGAKKIREWSGQLGVKSSAHPHSPTKAAVPTTVENTTELEAVIEPDSEALDEPIDPAATLASMGLRYG